MGEKRHCLTSGDFRASRFKSILRFFKGSAVLILSTQSKTDSVQKPVLSGFSNGRVPGSSPWMGLVTIFRPSGRTHDIPKNGLIYGIKPILLRISVKPKNQRNWIPSDVIKNRRRASWLPSEWSPRSSNWMNNRLKMNFEINIQGSSSGRGCFQSSFGR